MHIIYLLYTFFFPFFWQLMAELLGIQSPRLQLRTCRQLWAGRTSTWPMPSWLYKADHNTRPIIALIEADDNTKPVTAHLMMHWSLPKPDNHGHGEGISHFPWKLCLPMELMEQLPALLVHYHIRKLLEKHIFLWSLAPGMFLKL